VHRAIPPDLTRGAASSSEATRQRETKHYLARVTAERESQRMPDDATADAARLGAPDPRGYAPA
jgi:glycerol-3-phosphate dehydrogenase